MSGKLKIKKVKSLKKLLLSEVEVTLSASLISFPKKAKEKKYNKIIHKASKMITRTLAVLPVKAVDDKKAIVKTKKLSAKKPEPAVNQ